MNASLRGSSTAMTFTWIISLLIGLSFTPCATAGDYNPNGWRLPRVDTATREKTWRHNVDDGIPGKETIVQKFRQPDGKVFYTLGANGWVYAVVIGEKREYELIDVNGDGKFEQAVDGSKPQIKKVPRWVYERKSSSAFEGQCKAFPDPSCRYGRLQSYNLEMGCDPERNPKCRRSAGSLPDATSGSQDSTTESRRRSIDSKKPDSPKSRSGSGISDACFCVDEQGKRFSPLFGAPGCDVSFSARDYVNCR